jgi:hypothetical protein
MAVRTIGFITLVHGREKGQSRREYLGNPKMHKLCQDETSKKIGDVLFEVLRPS